MSKDRARNLVIAVVLIATLSRVWLGPITIEPAALAQIPDAGAQRNELIAEIRKSNQLLAGIAELLEKRTLNVRVVPADKP